MKNVCECEYIYHSKHFWEISYSKDKTKGVFAYVSNFSSQQYNRLKTMK